MNQNEVILHGEAMIFPINQISSSAKKIEPSNETYHIIADSETTGNHHVVDANADTEFYMDDNGTMYMEAKSDTQVSCVHENRHSPIDIPAGTYEFGIQQEYDHFAENYRNVAD
jgi:hypothetical protein